MCSSHRRRIGNDVIHASQRSVALRWWIPPQRPNMVDTVLIVLSLVAALSIHHLSKYSVDAWTPPNVPSPKRHSISTASFLCLHASSPKLRNQDDVPPVAAPSTSSLSYSNPTAENPNEKHRVDIWEQMAMLLVNDSDITAAEGDLRLALKNQNYNDESRQTEAHQQRLRRYVQYISLLRVGLPALLNASAAKLLYAVTAIQINHVIHDGGVFAVVAQDASQFIQNILTTSGLVFALLVGQTYYFMYQQQEATYLALYAEVTMAKSLLEQVALVCQGRQQLYKRILQQMDRYVNQDLQRFNDVEPAILLSARPCDDPLEDILYLTSVGEPSMVYQTIRSLRQARAYRLAALQRKLPSIHMTLLWVLAGIVLFTFPLLGAGTYEVGGDEILNVQSWYLSFIVLGITLVMGVVQELQRPGESGAYNARIVLTIMVTGLEEELRERLQSLDGTVSDDLERWNIDGEQIMDTSV